MYNKKAMIVPVLGTVLVVFAIVLASVIGLVVGPTFQGEAIQKGGLGISIHNHAEFWIKALDESVQIISRRSAYDLGKSGGIIGPEVFTWFTDYPTIDALQKNLESQIKESLPQGTIKSTRIIEWGGGFIDVLYLDCGPIASSECFFVKGNKSLTITDKAIEAKISLNPHKFYFKIDSNYFRLLNAGRTILDIDPFKSIVFVDKDLGKLLREINNAKAAGDSRFKDLNVETTVNGDVVEFTILDETCLLKNDNYCIAPLKPGETGIINPMDGKLIPYDFLKLKFRVNVENPIAPPICMRSNPTVTISPSSQTGPAGSTLTYTVSVRNNDGSDCGSSIFVLSATPCPSGLICTLNKNSVTVSASSTGSTTITVNSFGGTSPGTYTFGVKATNYEETSYSREGYADYVIPVPPPCTGTVTPTISGTGTCIVSASMTANNCDGQSWQITDGSNGCTGSVSGSSYSSSCPTQWQVSSGASGTTYTYILRIGGIQKDSKSVTCSPPACTRSNPTVSISPLSNTGSAGTSLTYVVSVKNNDALCSDSVFGLTYTCPSGWSCVLNKNSVTLSAGSTDSSITITVTSLSSATSGTYSFSVTATNNGAATYKGTGTGSYVIPVVPVCSATLTTLISGTGTCTVSASFAHTNCDSLTWQIKDSGTNAVVCDKTLPDTSCQWTVLSGSFGTTYVYNLYIDGSMKGSGSVTCNPGTECLSNLDCTGGSRCTDKICDNGICKYPPKPAGTVFATKSGTCPAYCTGGYKYTSSVTKTCDRVCDGTANEPDCFLPGCSPSDYSSQSCGTNTRTCSNYCSGSTKYTSTGNQQCNNGCAADGINCDSCTPPTCSYTSQSCGTSSTVCEQKCEGGVEYSSGHVKTCNLACASDGINCASSCTASSCVSTDYDTRRTCHNGCNGVRCTWVYLCNYASSSNNEIQCLDCCDWGGCTAPYNCGCSVPAQIITEFQSSPSCYYYWDCCTGWSGPICTSCGWCPVTITASCGYSDACTYGKFCAEQKKTYTDSCQCCLIGCNTYWGTNECTINTQCAYSGSEPTCTYYTDYKCDCFGAAGYNFRWESSATFTATCS